MAVSQGVVFLVLIPTALLAASLSDHVYQASNTNAPVPSTSFYKLCSERVLYFGSLTLTYLYIFFRSQAKFTHEDI